MSPRLSSSTHTLVILPSRRWKMSLPWSWMAFPVGGNAQELALVRPGDSPVGQDLVPVDDEVVDGESDVRECPAQSRGEARHPPILVTGSGIVVMRNSAVLRERCRSQR